MQKPGRDKRQAPAKSGKATGAEGPLTAETPSLADVMRLQRTIGNQAVARLFTGVKAPTPTPPPSAPAAPSPGAHTFADGRTVYLKGDDGAVQRKIGNRGSKNSWVWFDPQISGVDENPRGKIDRIVYAKGALGLPKFKASKKHKNVVRQVDAYFVTMDENKYTKEEERVLPGDQQWFLKSPVDRGRDEERAAEEEQSEGEGGDVEVDQALIESSTLKGKAKAAVASAKGMAAAGKEVAGMAKGMAGKISYVKGNVDTALDYTQKAVGAIDKAGNAFPPLKAVTSPVSYAVKAVKGVRTLYLANELRKAGDAVPLTLGALTRAQEALSEVELPPGASDVETQALVEQTAEALATMQAWLEKALYGSGEEEESKGEES